MAAVADNFGAPIQHLLFPRFETTARPATERRFSRRDSIRVYQSRGRLAPPFNKEPVMKFAFFAICAFGFGGLGAAGYQQFGSWSNPLTGAPLAAAPVAHAASVVNPTAAFNDVRAKLQSGDFAKIPVAAPLQPPLPRMERFDPFKSGALDPKDLEKFKNIHVNGARASVSHQFNQTNSVRNSLPGPQPFPRR